MTRGLEWPKISIVTPSYNQGEFIEETIRSVIFQNYPNLEYIIVDGGSSDSSVNVIRKYEKWLTKWISEPDSGQASAINKGFRSSTGQIMAWLNSDDCYKPGAIHKIAKYFMASEDARIVCGFRENIGDLGHNQRFRVYLAPDEFSLSRCCYIAQETVFWRREVWDTVGELNEDFQYALDYDYWQRILKKKIQISLLPEYISLFRFHSASKGSIWSKIRENEVSDIYAKYLGTRRKEEEAWSEISQKWWRRTAALHGLAHFGLLNLPKISRLIVSTLSLNRNEIPAINPQRPCFYF